jgi:hypothetical protein
VTHSSIKQEIVKQLDHLPLEQQRRVLDFTRALALSSPKGVPGRQLLQFAGILEEEDSQAMIQAIDAGCDQDGHKTTYHWEVNCGSDPSSQDN